MSDDGRFWEHFQRLASKALVTTYLTQYNTKASKFNGFDSAKDLGRWESRVSNLGIPYRVWLWEDRSFGAQKKPSQISATAFLNPARFDLDHGWLRADGTPVYLEALKRG